VSLFLDRSQVETLYDRHGSDVFNFCLRVAAGSRDAAATATRAAFLGIGREPRAEGHDRHDAGVRLLAAARRELAGQIEAQRDCDATSSSPLPVREANARLDVRYREVLAPRELVGCSYEEIGRIVGADTATVAELLWRGRLALRDELKDSKLSSIAPLADSCRRGLALIAMDWDGELHDLDEQNWLRGHLRTCGKCRLSQSAAREASASYRAWAPAPTPMGMRDSLLDGRTVSPLPIRPRGR
jgi:hypothetical protein